MTKSTSSLKQKVGASLINCSLIVLLSLPLYPLLGTEEWKLATITSFFGYNLIFRKRCIGMRIMKTYIDPPTTVLYASLYTAGFSTFFYSAVVPFDLLTLNTLAQIWSITMTGNTLHANLAHQGTINEDTYVRRCKDRALKLLDEGHLGQAVGSMACDMSKYPNLQAPPVINMIGINAAARGDTRAVRDWIEGFN